MGRVNLRDVAELAGLSNDTARNVLIGKSASEDSRRKVLAAAKKLGYVYPGIDGRRAVGENITIRIYDGVRDPDTGFVGKERLKQRRTAEGVSLTDEVLRMLTFADENLPVKRRRR